jgi:hypothetical protein
MRTTIPPKLATLLARLRERGEVRRAGDEWRARCPAHDDGSPSLYVALSLDRKVTLLNCKAGCDAEDVVTGLGMSLDDLFHDGDGQVEVAAEFGENDATPPAGVTPTGTDGEPTDSPGVLVGEVAGPDVRHEVYGQLLDLLPLADRHRQALRGRGLGEAHIDRAGYRTLERFALHQAVGRLKLRFDEATLLGVPGFRRRHDRVRFGDVEGLLVPVRDLEGRIVALKIRRDGGDDGPKYVWASSADEGPQVSFLKAYQGTHYGGYRIGDELVGFQHAAHVVHDAGRLSSDGEAIEGTWWIEPAPGLGGHRTEDSFTHRRLEGADRSTEEVASKSAASDRRPWRFW